jgi:hypothetical protein
VWLAQGWLLLLFGQDQFAMACDTQLIVATTVTDGQCGAPGEQGFTVDAAWQYLRTAHGLIQIKNGCGITLHQ